jgi:uncharacterized membrane protein YbhN (UPF0104 family)
MATSFMAFSIGNNLGVAALSGGSVRYRLYSANGLPASEIGWIIAFCTLTFALGVMTLSGLSLLFEAGSAATVLHIQRSLGSGVGVAVLAIVVAGGGAPARPHEVRAAHRPELLDAGEILRHEARHGELVRRQRVVRAGDA